MTQPTRRLQELGRGRALTIALACAVVAAVAYPIARCAYNLSFATLGRDTGIYQFVAWAIRHGQRPYVDIRENNGPLVYVEHLVALALGGRDEHVFRTFDIAVQCSSYFIAGVVACGPWSARTRANVLERALFGLLGVGVLFSQYVVYDWWATAQRESTYDAVLLIGLSLQLAAHQRVARAGRLDRAAMALLAASGAFVTATWFGKPTYVLCSAAQAGALLFDRELRPHLKKALGAIVVGSSVAAVGFVAFIAAIGDVAAYVRIVMIEAPKYYLPIWRQTLFGTYHLGHNAPLLNQGVAALGVLVVLLAIRFVPASMVLGTIPVAFGLGSFFAQRKGFYYHLHPVTCGAYWVWVLLLGASYDRVKSPRAALDLGAFALLACLIGYESTTNALYSDFYAPKWMPSGRQEATRDTREFYGAFWSLDFDGYDVHAAARYLAQHTAPQAGVQMYGLEPYVLFLAERRTATPFIYLYDLNMDPAFAGGPGGVPTAEEAAELRRLQSRNARALYDGLVARPPGAFVLVDRAPMAYAPDALVDFRAHCPDAARWMEERYAEAARFGALRVFLPRVAPD